MLLLHWLLLLFPTFCSTHEIKTGCYRDMVWCIILLLLSHSTLTDYFMSFLCWHNVVNARGVSSINMENRRLGPLVLFSTSKLFSTINCRIIWCLLGSCEGCIEVSGYDNDMTLLIFFYDFCQQPDGWRIIPLLSYALVMVNIPISHIWVSQMSLLW